MSTDLHSRKIGITLGDPAGVGPEIIVKSLAAMSVEERRDIVVFGTTAALEAAARITGAALAFGDGTNGTVAVAEVALDQPLGAIGKVDPRNGDAAFRYIRTAVEWALAGNIGCITTAPINKEALNAAGHHYDGHTGLLAALTKSKSSYMLLASERLSVVHVSTHVSLRDAIERATTERVLATIRAGYRHFRRLGISPRIAVAGLNPHCGEHGLFGSEDDERIAPAVVAARAEGIDVVGPIPPDTVYHRAYEGAFDLVVAQYHDQGHIPMKLVAFDTGVNISLGLPIARTSVDHGTAFDIAGTGRANHINMDCALDYARRLAATPKLAAGVAA